MAHNVWHITFLCFTFQCLNIFHSIFCSWFCFQWITFAEMKCQCAGIATEQAWCAFFCTSKAVDLSFVMHVMPYFPLAVSPQCFSLSVSHSLLLVHPSNSGLCTSVSAIIRISLGFTHSGLQFNRQVFLQCFKSLGNRSELYCLCNVCGGWTTSVWICHWKQVLH